MSEHQNTHQKIQNTEIAIVGGGMVGMSLALMLAKKKCSDNIVLIEPGNIHSNKTRDWSPSFDDRSTALSAGTIGLLKQLNLWSALQENASPITTVKVSDRGHLGFTQYSQEDNAGEILGAVVENAHLGRALLDDAISNTSIQLVDKTSVSHIAPKSGCAELTLENAGQKQSLRADLVVLADGALSSLADGLGIEFEKHNYKQHAIITNVAHTQAHNGRAFECFCEQGPVAMLPLTDFEGKYRSALVWTNENDKVALLQSMDKRTFLQTLQRQFGYRLGTFTDVGELSTYPLNLYLAKEQVRSSLVLMGNAAHFLHPVAGQGFNLAVRDCAELCEQIHAGKKENLSAGDFRVLQNYAQSREWDQQLTTKLSHSFIKMFASAHPAKQVSRNAALIAMHKFGPLRSQFFGHMMGKVSKSVVLS